MLTLTDETKTITISDTSIIKKQSMAAPGSSSSNSSSASSTASLSDITVGSVLKLTYTSDKLSSVEIVGGMNGGSGAPGGTDGGSGSPTITGTGAYTKSGTASDQKITAASSNQSGIRISDRKTLTLTNSAITKSGKTTSEDESNFYGLNAGVAALNKSTVKLSNSSITTNADGANAAFAYGTGSTVTLDNVTINTSANSSRGLDAKFFITNTDAVITLNNTKLTGTATLIKAAATTRWGQTGSNGGNVILTANSQTLSGNVAVDKISTAAMTLNKSVYTGTINKENTAKSVSLKLSKDSTWNVTGTSYLTSIADSDTTLSNIKDNGNTIYYDSTNGTNSWLNGKTVSLSGGGKLTPVK